LMTVLNRFHLLMSGLSWNLAAVNIIAQVLVTLQTPQETSIIVVGILLEELAVGTM